MEINSKLLLFSDNKTNKYLPGIFLFMSKDNQKNMNHKTWNYSEQDLVKDKFK